MSLGENDCQFNGYDNKTKDALCKFEIKNRINIYQYYSIDVNKIKNNFC